MNGKILFCGCALLLALTAIADARNRGKMRRGSKSLEKMLADEPLFSVEAIDPLNTRPGVCQCQCKDPKPAPLTEACINDIIVAVDSSACFRDHQRRTKQFLQRLVGEIHRSKNAQFGVNKTRLAILQFSSEQITPVRLDSFKNYSDPESSKRLKALINEEIASLPFLGEGSFLDKALNATVEHFTASPRPYNDRTIPRKRTVIVLTNGKSHPQVSLEDVQRSVRYVKSNGIKILPVSVTRQCYSVSSEWDEGLCPDPIVMKVLGEGSYEEGDDFLPMRATGTVTTVVNEATECGQVLGNLIVPDICNCSCELPVGPRGKPGDKGDKGESITGPRGDRGPRGDDGDIGPAGPQGTQGPKGNQGEVGPKGDQGEDGPEGIEGPTGPKGERGDDGYPGEIGPRGDKGEIGEKGDTGAKGDVGNEGPKGIQGYKGAKGVEGDVGPRGPTGPKGEPGIGIEGPVGKIGEKGEKGHNGTDGPPGERGNKGDRGLCGKPGPAGLKGMQGIAGINGANGDAGERGVQGPRGPEGLQGQKGSRGEPGLNGQDGETGPRGSEGPEGPHGPRGSPGRDGLDSNVPGPRGPEGARGPKGERGENGIDGLHGEEGPRGQQGPRGPAGQKGEEGTLNIDNLRPVLVELIRELLPGECVDTDCTEYPVDLVFMIDGSDSIDRDDFSQVQDWILKTVDRFNPADRKQKLHVDVVQFSEAVRTEVHQIVGQSSEEIRPGIESINQMRSGTKTYRGLRYVNSDVTPNLRSGSFKMLITMSDGDASEDRDEVAVDNARAAYNLMLAVGIGEKIHMEQLEDFTYRTEPISVDEFASLGGIIDKIVEASCKNIKEGHGRPNEETTTTTPTTTTKRWDEPTPPPLEELGSTRCADSRADIAFLIDGSSSVGDDDFNILKSFLHDTVDSFDPTNSLGFRVSILQYNEKARTELSFDQSVDKESVLSAIKGLQYMTGGTRTGNALDTIGAVFADIRSSGTRVGVPQLAVVVTDGRSQDDVAEPAQALREAGVAVFAVGVTETSLQEELSDIASSEDKIFTVTSYDAIDSIKEDLLKKLCESVRGSYVVYDELGHPVEQISFGDDDEDTSRGDNGDVGSGVMYEYDLDAMEEDDELQ